MSCAPLSRPIPSSWRVRRLGTKNARRKCRPLAPARPRTLTGASHMPDRMSDMSSNWLATAHIQGVREAPGSQSAHESGMIGQRAGYLLVGLIAALGAALSFGPDTLSVARALTAFACASVAMLTTAVGALL